MDFQYQCSRNCLQRNNGSGTSFSETALLAGISATDWSWCPLFADYDNDGNKDLFISSGIVKRPVDLDYIRFVSDLYVNKNANKTDKYDNDALDQMPDGKSRPFFFRGDGNANFKEVSSEWGTADMSGYYNGAAYADLDNDGNLDMIINTLDTKSLILKNINPKKNWLSVTFQGDSGNTKGIGAKAYAFHDNKMQYQQLMLTRGFQSSVEAKLHFGLDSSAAVDSLLIVWPDQKFQVISRPALNRNLVASHKNAAGTFLYKDFFKPSPQVLAQVNDLAGWKHEENAFDDFNVQYLIPHQQSTRGPKMAVADINGDGLDDIYLCGARNQPGALMVRQTSGKFILTDTSVFNADKDYEDVDAIFFDANGDGKPDLYVVSGGNELTGKNPLLSDRLYINSGKGNFSRSPDALPANYSNRSTVAVADIDKDGDMDIFSGTLADAKAYGIPQSSQLLINDGKGIFSLAASDIISLSKIGMITSSVFADVDKNGWPDLIVTGEWMPVTIFKNTNGKFSKTEVQGSTGLWQTVFADDINNDGSIDFLAGNWGLNNKFSSGKDGPLRMYVSDYDNNGQTDQLVSYSEKGKEFPFLAKDEVERSLPLLKKHYLKYAEYAGVIMKDVFYGWIDTITPVKAERLASAVFINDGKGNFTITDLPENLQLAPIFTFQKLAKEASINVYAAGGNFFDVIPYEGKYDGQALTVFSFNKNIPSVFPPGTIPFINGQVRDIKWINAATGNLLAVTINNDSVRLLKYDPSSINIKIKQ